MRFYREKNGDFMAVEWAKDQRQWRNGHEILPCRAAAIVGLASSVCSTSAQREYVKKCKAIRRADVPQEWLRYIGA